jgi:hypothetical protein
MPLSPSIISKSIMEAKEILVSSEKEKAHTRGEKKENANSFSTYIKDSPTLN